jgi:hypothetical protein
MTIEKTEPALKLLVVDITPPAPPPAPALYPPPPPPAPKSMLALYVTLVSACHVVPLYVSNALIVVFHLVQPVLGEDGL